MYNHILRLYFLDEIERRGLAETYAIRPLLYRHVSRQ